MGRRVWIGPLNPRLGGSRAGRLACSDAEGSALGGVRSSADRTTGAMRVLDLRPQAGHHKTHRQPQGSRHRTSQTWTAYFTAIGRGPFGTRLPAPTPQSQGRHQVRPCRRSSASSDPVVSVAGIQSRSRQSRIARNWIRHISASNASTGGSGAFCRPLRERFSGSLLGIHQFFLLVPLHEQAAPSGHSCLSEIQINHAAQVLGIHRDPPFVLCNRTRRPVTTRPTDSLQGSRPHRISSTRSERPPRR